MVGEVVITSEPVTKTRKTLNMNKEYICYCGLYCGNCDFKTKLEPAAKKLHEEIKKAGYDYILPYIPGGDEFWQYLQTWVNHNFCVSCKAGSGNPGCAIRICAKEKSVEVCALCESYPCGHFTDLLNGCPVLKDDNAVLRERGMDEWAKLQDERQANGFAYSETEQDT